MARRWWWVPENIGRLVDSWVVGDGDSHNGGFVENKMLTQPGRGGGRGGT